MWGWARKSATSSGCIRGMWVGSLSVAMAGEQQCRRRWRHPQAAMGDDGTGDPDRGGDAEPDRVAAGAQPGGGGEQERGDGARDGAPRRALGGAAAVSERVEALGEHEWPQEGAGALAGAEHR